MSDKTLKQAEQELEKAESRLRQAQDALEADQIVEAIVDQSVPDLAPDAVQLDLKTPAKAKAGTLDAELAALKENAAETKFDEEVMKAEES